MGKRRIFTKEEIDKIISLYETKEMDSTHKLAKLFGTSHKMITKILRNNEICINSKGGQNQGINSDIITKHRVKKFTPNINKKYVAICKYSGTIINDPNNLSGYLTIHLKSLNLNIPIPKSNYERKKYELQTGKKWFELYFDIREIDDSEKRRCKLCDWDTIDLKNKSGMFESHVKNKHQLNIDQYLEQFPEDKKYHTTQIRKIERLKKLNEIGKSVECQICKEKFYSISSTHLKKHGVTPFEYSIKYGQLISDELSDLYRQNMIINNKEGKTVRGKKSELEKEIMEFLTSNDIPYVYGNRFILDGKEIDILIEDQKIGIEIHGNIHHTEIFGKKSRYYHWDKTNIANRKGYRLIQIFSDEWKNSKEIVKSKLLRILGKDRSTKLGARKCIIKEIGINEKNIFLNKYHIQGYDRSTIKLGAFYNELLVGVMTFLENSDESILSRFATNYDYSISGLGSKLLSFYIKNYKPNKIVSFADRRWTTDVNNNLYIKLGFQLSSTLKPDYHYYHPRDHTEIRHHKFGFRKKSLFKKYPTLLNMSMTESEMVKILGYDRIWDCGLFKYELMVNKEP